MCVSLAKDSPDCKKVYMLVNTKEVAALLILIYIYFPT